MLSLPDLSSFLKGVNSDLLEDVADRLNFYVTIYMVLFFTLITGSKQHFGQPISCMGSAEVHGVDAWSQYLHDYCYVGTKHLVTDHKALSSSSQGAAGVGTAGVGYYQWVPYLLLLQVMFFYLPKVLWQSASYNYGNGVDMEAFVSCSIAHHGEYGDDRRGRVRAMARFLTEASKYTGILGSRRDSMLYCGMKWACVGNALGQLYFMAWFIADGTFGWAFNLMDQLYGPSAASTRDNDYFPRVAYCDAERMELGQPVRYTLQCVLMFNFVNEKIFLLLFCWTLALLVVNVFTALRQTLQLVCPPFRLWTARMLLPSSSTLFRSLSWSPVQSSSLLSYFVHSSLGCDGIFLLEAVASHSGRIMAREIATELFHIIIKKKHDIGFKKPSFESLPRPKILDFNESVDNGGISSGDSLRRRDDYDIEKRSLLPPPTRPPTLDRRASRSSPTISAPPYHSLFTESGRDRAD